MQVMKKKIVDLKIKLQSANADSDKIKILSDLSWELQTNDIDAAEKYSQQELKLAEKVNLEKFYSCSERFY
jgi:hypothetical protein